jgi:hypothetical protein
MPSTIQGSGNGIFATRNIEAVSEHFSGDAILFRDGELKKVSGPFGIHYRDSKGSIS